MAEQDQDQKTEAPTGKRLGEARERGQLAISRETTTWVFFVAVLLVVAWIGPMAAENMVPTLRIFLESPHTINLEGDGLQAVLIETMQRIGMATLLIYAVLAAGAVAGTMLQTGLFASVDSLRPQFDRISPLAGIHRLLSTNSLVELGKSFGKMVVLGLVVYITLKPVVETLPLFSGRDMLAILAYFHHQAVHLVIMLLLVFTVIAVADLVYTRHSYTKSLRMTKAEVKDEFRQQEGDPLIKNRLRSIRIEKARKRMMAQVPKADVIVTNPTHYAIALKYDNSKMAAPVVLAKGLDRVAERIREVATESNIPFVSNPPLARALYETVDIDQAIPTQHYRAVAEVISYVYKLKKKKF
jgi:flagellar biosynthetic protein FlhB